MRGRVVLPALLLVAALLLAVPGLAKGGQGRAPAPATTTYTVRQGDTLWAIAERIAPRSDPRFLVDKLTEYNHVDGPLQAGQQLVLPAPAKAGSR